MDVLTVHQGSVITLEKCMYLHPEFVYIRGECLYSRESAYSRGV